MNRSRTIAGSLAVAALGLTAPLLVTVPAQASTTDSGCTVTPKRPEFSGKYNKNNIPLVDYKIEMTCNPGRTLHLEQERWEQDLVSREGDAPDDLTGTFARSFSFPDGGTKRIKVRTPLPNTGPANEGAVEELYQAVRFQVTLEDVTSAFTAWELTQVRSIHR
jgi:hypothetical protein